MVYGAEELGALFPSVCLRAAVFAGDGVDQKHLAVEWSFFSQAPV